MALRNRKQEEATKLKGVNLTDEVTDLELGWFSSLQNFVGADVFSLKKKRGVAALSTDAITPTVPDPC
jgi:hypothetical protein